MKNVSAKLQKVLDAWERSGRVASVVRKRKTGQVIVTLNGFKRFDDESEAIAYMEGALQGDQEEDRQRNPSRRSIHTAKWDRCVKDVSARGGAKSAAAVCTARIGYKGSVKKGHRRRNPADSRKIPSHSRIWELSNKWIGSRPSTDIYPSSPLVKQLRDAILVEKHAAEKGRVKVSSGLLTEMRSELSEVSRYMRQSNPLPAVRKLYYIICAVKGAEKYYLARSGKLTRSQAGAARFVTAAQAIDKAKIHLKNYAASRKYRFDLKLAY